MNGSDDCHCDDCEAAVSPAAYLTELLDYTLRNITNSNVKIDLEFLQRAFHQPFADLPVDCDAVEKQVRQVRICIEVLRSYLGKRPLADAKREGALAQAEKAYLIDAYTTLLGRIGTSFEAVRLARVASFEERKALAERLGINLTIPRSNPKSEPGDELDQLLLTPDPDPDTTPNDLRLLTEQSLERLFGLVDTTTDPLSEGIKLGDPNDAAVTRWNLDGAVWGRNTDDEGKVYLTISLVGGIARVDVFRDSARSDLVASNVQKAADEPVRVTPRNGSGLSGTFAVVTGAVSSKIEIAVIPKFLCWRLKNLRELWKTQDRPEDAYTVGRVSTALNAKGLVFPASLVPPPLANKIAYLEFDHLLTFDGMMAPDERKKLLVPGISTSDDYQTAVDRLYVHSQRPPIIDPDVIGPDDFRVPFAKAKKTDPDAPFDLWLARRKFVDKQRDTLKPKVAAATLDLSTLIVAMSAPVDYRGTKLAPWSSATKVSDLEDLLKTLTEGKPGTTTALIEAVKLKIRSDLNLTPESFTRLMQLRTKAEEARAKPPRNEELTDDEVGELLSILVQAQKTIFWSTWREEEEDLETRVQEPLISREFFWPSIREPKEGEWPLVATKDVPFIDPDIVKLTDLPEPTVGAKAEELWNARREEMDDYPGKLKGEREKNGFQSMLESALGNPLPHDLDKLLLALASTDENEVTKAKNAITADLHLTEDDFRRLMAIRAKDKKTKLEERPTAAEYAEIYAMLAKAGKFKNKYRDWANEETTAGFDDNYWLALKARLPKWRASFEARQAWKQAFALRTKDPIVDPDLIGFGDLRDAITGKPFDIMQARIEWLTKLRSDKTPLGKPGLVEMRSAAAGNLAGFKSIVEFGLGINDAAMLGELAEKNQQGYSIEARLEQLNLTNASFALLFRVYDLARNGQPIIEPEWEAVYSILIQVLKKRRFAKWRDEEHQEGILLGPDQFAIFDPTAITIPPTKPKTFDPWRASWIAFRDWQDLLQSRTDQDLAVIAGMHDAVGTTEEIVLPQLRDALVDRTACYGADLEERGTWLTGRLFIDAKAGGCQKTTRVAQAIETLQSLVMAARTGQLRRNFTDIKQIPGWFGSESRDGGIAVADITRNGRPNDLVVFHIDKGSTSYEGYYRIGRNLDAYGKVADDAWSWKDNPDPAFKVKGPLGTLPGDEIQGAGIAIADIDGNGVPDVIVFYVRHSSGGNKGFYRIGWNLDADGKVTGATPWSPEIALPSTVSLPSEIQGAAIAVADVTGTGKLDLIIFYIDSPTSPPENHGKYLIGSDLDATGTVTGTWIEKTISPEFGWENEGAGVAVADFDGDGTNDLLVFFVDNPWERENAGWYRVGHTLDSSGNVAGGWSKEGQPRLQVPGWFGEATQGAGVAVADISGTGRPNLIVFHIDNPSGDNAGYYRIGWDITAPQLTLAADNFDKEWKWMGSYATWRAAMFVFLYPENILLPNLRNYKTPAFESLIEKLRSDRHLTPQKACEVAKEYAGYVRDICSLRVEATCQTKSKILRADFCQDIAVDERYYMYLFGREESGKVYWSVLDPNDTSDYPQRPWRVWPFGDAALRIAGATPYKIDANRQYIYVFFIRRGTLPTTVGTTFLPADVKISFVRFDLNRQDWEGGITDLPDPPVQKYRMRVVIHQAMPEKLPPLLAVWPTASSGTGVIQRHLNQEGDGWTAPYSSSEPEWEQFEWKWGQEGSPGVANAVKPLLPVTDLHAALADGTSYHKDIGDQFVTAPGGLYRWYEDALGGNDWLGMYLLINSDQGGDGSTFWPITLRAFFRDAVTKGPVCGAAEYSKNPFGLTRGPITRHPTLSGVERVVSNWGNVPAADTRIAYVRESLSFVSGMTTGTYCCPVGKAPDGISGSKPTLILPALSRNETIQLSMPGQDPGHRQSQQQHVFQVNDGASGSIMALLEEAYFLVPMYIASRLQVSGEFIAALDWFRVVYDYSSPSNSRKIYYGLLKEESGVADYSHTKGWLRDPLNPHAIAGNRQNAYSRFTVLSIIRCLLEYADAEFTYDTGESVARARILYTTALELLDLPALKQQLDTCDKKIAHFVIEVGEDITENVQAAMEISKEISTNITRIEALESVLTNIKIALTAGKDWNARLKDVRSLVEDAVAKSPESVMMGSVLSRKRQFEQRAYSRLLKEPSIKRAARTTAEVAGANFLNAMSGGTGISTAPLENEKIDLSWLRYMPMEAPGGAGPDTSTSLAEIKKVSASPLRRKPRSPVKPPETLMDWKGNTVSIEFCIPPNPILRFLRLRAEINLHKLRTCRNIAGMKRQLDPYAAPTDTVSGLPTIGAGGQLILPGTTVVRPTPYRYTTLIERAKQLVQLAAQVEAEMLMALEKGVAEAYTLLKARQDLGLAQANIQLQNLRVNEANNGVALATLQQARAKDQADHFKKMLEEGLTAFEEQAVDLLSESANLQNVSALSSIMAAASYMLAAGATIGPNKAAETLSFAGSALSATSSALSSIAQATSTLAQIQFTLANFERQRQDWAFQEELAEQDVAIGIQQVTIANNHVELVKQEKVIAEIQTANAKDTVEFLNNKFTNVDLYDWMSDVLGRVYSFFLQQATAVAKLAENQLAFERQEVPQAYIQGDYWQMPSEGAGAGSTDGKALDRRGLTGSARLLQDIYQLDQYAFDTNKRKLQLVKVLSLSRLAPFEFQQFRETGVLPFATPMEMFDRDFPGHYLRLIKRVRTSVIALVPPSQGIHATLSTLGLSRVVIGPEIFQTVPIRRDPEMVALSSPINATGLFELEAQSDMLFPFEGSGVDSTWEFRMPKPANLLDYRTIADVLITIEYTALNSADYYQQVIQSLRPTVSADRPFSFRNAFADQWYDLNNADVTSTPMTVRFRTFREDFPPNLDAIKIQQVVLYFARAGGKAFEVPSAQLGYAEQGTTGFVGGAATTIDGVISTRRANAGSWLTMQGKSPVGEWELALPNTEEMRNRFKNEEIEDILLVITYSGRTPDWPN